MRRFWYLGVIVVVVVFTAAIFYGVKAQQPEQKKIYRVKPFGAKFEQMKLNLTEAQKEQIHTIVIQTKKEMLRKMADIRVAGIELREMIADKKVSDEAIKEKQAQIQKLRQEAGQIRMNTLLQVRQILTDEQWTKASKMHLFKQRRIIMRHMQGVPGMRPGRQMRLHGWWGSENKEGPAGEIPLFGEWENILGGESFFSDNFMMPPPPPEEEMELGMEPELPMLDVIE